MNLQPGQLITAPFLPSKTEVKKFEPRSGYALLEVVLKDGRFADIRFIEVKGRVKSGSIRISANEWKKARHFGDKYWLYLVVNADSIEPILNRIDNPASIFKIDEGIFASGHIIPEENWKSHYFKVNRKNDEEFC